MLAQHASSVYYGIMFLGFKAISLSLFLQITGPLAKRRCARRLEDKDGCTGFGPGAMCVCSTDLCNAASSLSSFHIFGTTTSLAVSIWIFGHQRQN